MSIISNIRKRTLSNQANIDFEILHEPHEPVIPEDGVVQAFKPEFEKPEKISGIPKRFIFTLLGFFGFFNCHAMRFNFSMAMVAMVRPPPTPEGGLVNNQAEACMELMKPTSVGNSTELLQSENGEFDWDSELQHLALGSFYFGYVAFQIPGGILAEKRYAKNIYGLGILATAIFTLLTPMAARHSIGALIAARTIQGIGQAATWPAMNTLIGRWVPTMERTRVSAIIYTGCTVGVVVSFAVSGILCDSTFLGGWPSVFYIFGAIGVVWYIFWIWLIYETPEEHPGITKAEIRIIRKGQEEIENIKIPIPWKSILTSVPVWGLVIVHFGQDWGGYTLQTETPLYLSNVLHYDLKENGILSAIPNIFSAVMAFLTSVLADKVRQKGYFSNTVNRKIFNSIGFYGPGLCMLFVTFVGCSPAAVIFLLCLAMGLNGFVYSGFNITHIDMSPEFAGTLMAITNSIANIAGFLVPMFVGYVIHDGNTLKNWNMVFITAFIIFAVCGTVYNVFCSADLQEWRAPVEQLPETHGDDQSISSYTSENQLTVTQREIFRYRRMSFLL